MFLFSLSNRNKVLFLMAIVLCLSFTTGVARSNAANSVSIVLSDPDPVESQRVDFTATGNTDARLYLYATSRIAGEACGASYKSELDKGAKSEVADLNEDGPFSDPISMDSRSSHGKYVMCVYLQNSNADLAAVAMSSTTVTLRRQKSSLRIEAKASISEAGSGAYDGMVDVTATGFLELDARTLYVKVKRSGEPGCAANLSADQLGFHLGDTFILDGSFTNQNFSGSGGIPGQTYNVCAWLQNGVSDTDPDATASTDVTIPNAPVISTPPSTTTTTTTLSSPSTGEGSQVCTDARTVLAKKQNSLTTARKKLAQLRKKARKARGKKAKKKAIKRVRVQQKKVQAAQKAVSSAQNTVNTQCK